MKMLASNARLSFALCVTLVAGCDSAPPGVVDDRDSVSTVEFTAGAREVPLLALVTSVPSSQTYRNWSSLQPYLANPQHRDETYREFEVISGPEHLVILIPPVSWNARGWVMVCEDTTYRQDHGACDTEGMVGTAVVSVTGWTSDMDHFRAIVTSGSNAVGGLLVAHVRAQQAGLAGQ